MTMIAGTRLGPYEIREPLGAGGMGEVYVAEDTRLGRQVAVKVLPESFAADASRLARFAQEARAAAALNHPHIAAVFDVGEERGTHYMVQELLEGKTLREVMGSPMAATRAIPLATEIAEALAAAHKAGIVHRDLKPDNIFVAEDGHAKVLDFGLAKLTEPGGAPGTEASMSPTMLGTEAGEVMGTAGYMAPEQAQGAEVDHRADLFALGCVLYEMITGRGPFAGKNVYDTLGKIVSDDPAPIDSHVPSTPLELQRIVRKCLSKQPELRYQNAADAAVDLRLLLREIEAGIAAPGGIPQAEPQDTPAGLSPVRVAGLLVATAVIAAVAVGWLMRAPAPLVAPLRTFDFAFPDDFPEVPPCCASQLALAPGGEFVVFAGEPEIGRTSRLFLRRLDTLDTRPVGEVLGGMPAVSPDGEWVVYMSRAETRGLAKVALAGGAPFYLGVATSWRPFWADDGYIYAVDNDALVRVPQNGGAPERIEPLGLEGDRMARVAVLPGGQTALLDVFRPGGEWSISVLDLGTRELSTLVDEGADPRWSSTGHVLWTRAGVVYAAPFDADARSLTGPAVPVLQGVASGFSGEGEFAVAGDGTLAWIAGDAVGLSDAPSQLVLVGESGDREPIVSRLEEYFAPRLSPAGRRIAVGVSSTLPSDEGGGAGGFSSDVWVLDIAQETLARLTSNGASDPVWSPDGEWIYFATGRVAGAGDIWRRRADFSAPAEVVLEQDGNQYPTDVTPDGNGLIFVEAVRGAAGENDDDGIWLLPLDGGEPVPLVDTPFDEYAPRISPDGRLLAFTSEESGTSQIYVRELDGQRRWAVSPGPGSDAVWAPDGLHLYYRARGRGAVHVVDMRFDDDLQQEPPRPLFDTPSGLSAPYDVSADGRVLAMVRADADDEPTKRHDRITITLNWFQELTRLAPRGQ